MTLKKRLQLWSQSVPGGWRVVNIRQGATINPFYFSPEGKRFDSLQAVKKHAEVAKKEDKKQRRRKRKRKNDDSFSEPTAKKLKFDDLVDDEVKKDSDIDPLSLPAEILKKRKMMTARSPFRNLLKRTLVRNHNRFRGRLPMISLPKDQESSKRQASDIEDEDGDQGPQSKRQKIVRTPPKAFLSTSKDKNETEDETENKRDEDSLLQLPSKHSEGENRLTQNQTPPRITQPRRNFLFTPPNLTPPVSLRRNSNITFSSPNQRPLVSRITKPIKPASCISKTS